MRDNNSANGAEHPTNPDNRTPIESLIDDVQRVSDALEQTHAQLSALAALVRQAIRGVEATADEVLRLNTFAKKLAESEGDNGAAIRLLTSRVSRIAEHVGYSDSDMPEAAQ